MKNLKKFVALLLAGVMAMVMLTACTGGNGSNLKEDTKTEDEVLSKYSTSTVAAKNDRALKAEAEKFLNDKLDVSGSIFGYKFVLGYDVKGRNDANQKYLTVLVAANVTYKDTLLGAILDEISRKINTDTNVNINQNSNWTKIGVVVKTDINTKQSYMAIAFQIKNPNYNGK